MLAILAAALMQAAAPDTNLAGPLPPGLTNADWLQRPTGADLAHVFPSDAARKGIEGAVTLLCRVSLEGTAVDCKIEREEPAGQGFGVAALKLSAGFRLRPQTRNGVPEAGGLMRIPIGFFMPQGRVPSVKAAYPGLTGHTDVHCRVSEQHRLENCIAAEAHNKLLADVALKVASQVTLDGTTRVGLRLVVPVEITAAELDSAPTSH